MNELKVCLGRSNQEQGYTTVNASPRYGDYAHFQPGPGNSMGFDDLKVIEAKKFLVAVAGGAQENSNIHDAASAAAIVSAAEASSISGQWQKIEEIHGTTAARV
jgi:hypothetical protein